jgi:hypothetical protein
MDYVYCEFDLFELGRFTFFARQTDDNLFFYDTEAPLVNMLTEILGFAFNFTSVRLQGLLGASSPNFNLVYAGEAGLALLVEGEPVLVGGEMVYLLNTLPMEFYSIQVRLPDESVFTGYFIVSETIVKNFYYVNQTYVEILDTNHGGELGEYESDNVFVDGNFTEGGVNIASVIPYMNAQYNPSKLNLYYDGDAVVGYKTDEWRSMQGSTFTFTQIPELPPLAVRRPRRFALFPMYADNARVLYKPHSLTTGGGSTGVRIARIKRRKT